MHTRGGFLGHALDLGFDLGEPAGALGHALGDLRLDHGLFFGLRHGDDLLARLGARAQKHIKRRVATIVEDHVRPIGELEGFIEIIPMLFQCLALDRENRDARLGDGGSRVILRREDVAAGPAHIGAQIGQGFNQDRGLDRHVERAHDARTLERLFRAVFFAQRHQARHLGLGDIQFLAAEIGQRDVLDDVIGHFGLSLLTVILWAT